MANDFITLSKRINPLNGFVTSADKIAFETRVDNLGLPNEETVMTKSLATKIAELITTINNADITNLQSLIDAINTALENVGTTADKIIYTPAIGIPGQDGYIAAISVKDKLNLIVAQLGAMTDIGTPAINATYYTNVDEYNSAKGTSLTAADFTSLPQSNKIKTEAVEATGIYKLRDDTIAANTSATSQATLAKTAAELAASSLTSISTEKNKAIASILEEYNSVKTNLTTISNKLDTTDALATKLVNAFNVSNTGSNGNAQFAVMSQDAYNASIADESIDDNIVYFVYETDEIEDNYCIITVARSDSSKGYVTGGGCYKKNITNSVSLLAAPKQGFAFSGWTTGITDTIVSTDTNYVFTPTEDATYYALFYTPDTQYTVLVSAGTGGTATLTNAKSDNKYSANSLQTITATPNEHYTFKNWTFTNAGNLGSDTTNPKSITVNKDITYIANFEEDPKYTITVNCNSEQGEVTGGGTVYKNTSVTLVATPKTGYTFSKWVIGETEKSTSSSYTFSATETAIYTAIFTLSEDTLATGQDVTTENGN